MRSVIPYKPIALLGLGILGFVLACSPGPTKRSRLDTPQAILTQPYPEVEDTIKWDPLEPDSLRLTSSDIDSVSADTNKEWSSPPIPLPEGIRTQPHPKNLPDKIRVLLSRDSRTLSLYSLGELQVLSESPTLEVNPASRTMSVSKLMTVRGAIMIRRQNQGFEVLQGGKTLATTAASRLRLISLNRFNLIDLNGSVYRGSMHILGQTDGGIVAINVLGVEDYLRGVLPYELGTVDRASLEALKALAVVARTYAYKRMIRPGNREFHVFCDVQDQVYKGVKSEYLLSDRAVWETRGIAVLYRDSLAQCYYSSTCGGRTSSKHEVWGGESISYLLSRPDMDEKGLAYCRASKYSAWTEEWTQGQLAGIVKRNIKSAGVTGAPDFSRIRSLEVKSRATCGRIRILEIATDEGPIEVKGDKVRWALRPLPSPISHSISPS